MIPTSAAAVRLPKLALPGAPDSMSKYPRNVIIMRSSRAAWRTLYDTTCSCMFRLSFKCLARKKHIKGTLASWSCRGLPSGLRLAAPVPVKTIRSLLLAWPGQSRDAVAGPGRLCSSGYMTISSGNVFTVMISP